MQHSGKLLIKVSTQPYNNLRLGKGVLNIPNYNLEPVCTENLNPNVVVMKSAK